jgi:hypothetical protein
MKVRYLAPVLAYVSGLVNQELVLQVEYLAAENRILRAHLPDRLRLSNSERSALAEIGNASAEKVSRRLPLSPDRIPFWAGSGSSSPTSLMARRIARIQADRLPALMS